MHHAMHHAIVEITPAKHGCIHACMAPLQAIVVAEITRDGKLLSANQGFERLLWRSGEADPNAADPSAVFLNPSFEQLLSVVCAPDQPLHQGILTVVDQLGSSHSLIGAVHQHGPHLLLVAEHDIAEMQRLNAQVIALNQDLSDAHRKLARVNRELQKSQQLLLQLSQTDPLTGLANRRELMERLEQALARARRYCGVFSVIMADIDFFKKVNDNYGHDVGDQVIKAVATMMAGAVRNTDLVARFGGEEIVVLVQEAALQVAAELAERLRLMASELHFDAIASGIRCSFGVAQYDAQVSVEQLLKQADLALYSSKHAGRDRVTCHGAVGAGDSSQA